MDNIETNNIKMIIFSLTCHESIDCVYELIDNIKYHTKLFNIYILISTTKSLYQEFINKTIPDKVIIVTIRDDDEKMWGNILLFHQHILNLKYLFDNNISFDYFIQTASNQYFISDITPKILEEYTISIVREKEIDLETNYEDYYKELEKTDDYQQKNDIYHILQDSNFVKYLTENKIKLIKEQHEGCVMDYNVSKIIMTEYFRSKIFENSIYKNYVMEEYFISSYLKAKYVLKNDFKFLCIYYFKNYFNEILNSKNINRISHIQNIYNKFLYDDVISIKPIEINYNDPVRKFLRANDKKFKRKLLKHDDMIKLNNYNKEENYLELNDVYLYVIENNQLTYTIFDDKNIYLNSKIGLLKNQICFNVNSLDINYYTYLDGDYLSLIFQTSNVPSHNYEQFIKSLDFLIKKKSDNILVYKTDNVFYNNLNNFISKFILENNKFTYIEYGKLYKIKKIFLAIQETLDFIFKLNIYKNILNNIIPVKKLKKYFNLKLLNDNDYNNNWSKSRSFTNSSYIKLIMKQFNYELLDTSDEYKKQTQLRNSQYLILNWGGNGYINGHFSSFHTNKPILILCHFSYKHEYSKNIPGYIKNGILDKNTYNNKIRYVFDILDEIQNLDKIIEDFEKTYYYEINYEYNDKFDIDIYRNLNYDLNDFHNEELYIHYKNIGKNEGRLCSYNIPCDFNIETFKELNPRYKNFTDTQILEHYTKWGNLHNEIYKYQGLPLDFDVDIYKELNPNLNKLENFNAKLHYINHGI